MRSITRTLGMASIALSLSGCLGSTPTASLPADISSSGKSPPMAAGTMGAVVETERYFPLQRTYAWTYQVTVATPTGTSSAIDTTSITTLSDLYGTKTAAYLATRTADGTPVSQETGTITQNATTITLSGSGGAEIISLPFRSGAEWTSGTLTARSYAVASLKIGAKTYTDLFAIAYSRNGEVKAVRYFAAGYGIVKQISKSTQNGETVTVTSELTTSRLSSVTGVSLLPASLTLATGATASLNAQVTYDDGSVDKDLFLSVASQSIATVTASGVVTGAGTGTTVVSARSTQDPTKVATLSVTVQ